MQYLSYNSLLQVSLWHTDQEQGCYQEDFTIWTSDILSEDAERDQDIDQI